MKEKNEMLNVNHKSDMLNKLIPVRVSIYVGAS